ncbi:MAG: SDR family oxidoreductase [Anaerolineaceae bacterium]|jgi:3-oxoacyl-[acyl-carrier protein] reductase
MDLHLKDKTALVTGASRGLGYATAHLLAEEGARVVINSRSASNLAEAARKINQETHAHVFALPGDVADPAVPARLVEQAATFSGGLDILITNAGGPPAGQFETFDDEAWQKAVELSFLSQVRLIRAALPFLRKSKAASVLTITSISVKQPIPNLVLSNSIRSATIGLTKSLALELGKDGIRFNSILPAWVDTDRVANLSRQRAGQKGITVEDEYASQARDSALGRIAAPEEFANAAVFLVSPAASYLTGVMLQVDGGLYKATY